MSDDLTNKRQLPIGIFDSGVGGLTVYRALHNKLPNEHFIYLGDTARVPYGTKSMATVERYAIENSQFLASRGIKMLVVACNTASALALPKIREKIGLDVVGVIGPGGRKAVELTKEWPRHRNWQTRLWEQHRSHDCRCPGPAPLRPFCEPLCQH